MKQSCYLTDTRQSIVNGPSLLHLRHANICSYFGPYYQLPGQLIQTEDMGTVMTEKLNEHLMTDEAKHTEWIAVLRGELSQYTAEYELY